MKALVFHKFRDVRVEKVDDPVIEHPHDAIVRVTATAICGSDLHIYNFQFPQLSNMVLGHEFMGIVEEVGSEVRNLKKGDRVVVPFPISCGECFFCDHGDFPHCENSNPEHYGPEGGVFKQKGGALFGYTDLYGGYPGGQAEYVRVPYADVGPRKVSDDFTDEEVLFMTDIFPTGYAAIERAELKGGETVAVFGCGPVGLMAQKAAWLKGAGRVIGVDVEQYRLDIAKKTARAETMMADGSVEKIREMTGGRGADVVVDAVGMEADRNVLDRVKAAVHLQSGTINALKLCLSAVRRGGTVSVVGVYGTNYGDFPLGKIFEKGLRLESGQAPVQKYIDRLLEHLKNREVTLDDIITHKLPLSEASHGYDIFNKKKDNCVKVVLYPRKS
ncbi:zinc-dependent alcohol dehydrogenase [Zobellia alginiliquefaciens]|uniref:zinc-dependent alcohol dehydrogenase n=1 Tax=Zobellia alginiliquefaciens TaxID=3032586 RepID=UPI0023E3DEAD|nr:zinc-dependent alcohol dehydrogenase [Zobellia alginiliquefaciens]